MNFFTAIILGLSLLLTGCGLIDKGKTKLSQKKAKIYLSAQSAPPLQVPAGIPADSVGNTYPLPPAPSQAASSTPPGLLPPDSLADQIAKGKISPDVLKQKAEKPKQKQK